MKQSILSQQIPAAYRLGWKVTGDCFEYKVLFSTQVGYGILQSASWSQIANQVYDILSLLCLSLSFPHLTP